MSQFTIGIDLGGTQLRAGLVTENNLSSFLSKRINAQGSVDDVLNDLFELTDQLITPGVKGIGIGVPGLVDIEQGIVYDVVNIPSWKKVALRGLIEQRYNIPVFINNDANCFTLGEYYFGKGKGVDSLIGLTIGTGLGGGIIIHKKLYSGRNGGAGEFGMIDYLDKYVEYYASGQFFKNVHGINGEEAFTRAQQGDEAVLKMYAELGAHLGNAIRTILYAFDVSLIILGGSVRHAYPFFKKALWIRLDDFAFQNAISNLRIEISELENSGLLGAAALYYDQEK